MAGDFTSEKVLDQTTIADPNVCTSNFADEDKTPPQNSIDDQDMVKSEETGSIDKDVPPFELTGLPLALVMTGLGLSIFVMSLDGSIIATAIPRITSQFNSTGDIGWYGSAYTFAMCALQPICGKLFSSFALKATFLSFLAVFELGSLLCALAANSPMLIVGRAIAGAGGAGCATGAFCILAASLPLEKRPPFVGILQSTFGIASILGPIIGGALTQHATWRWCFWINLPIGALTFGTLLFFRPPPAPKQSKTVLQRFGSLDLVGAFLFAPAVIMLLLALQWGGTKYEWKSATIIGLFLGGAAVCALFIAWQAYKGDDAMIPPRLMTERTIFFSCIMEFFIMGAVFIAIYYLPEWFQVIKDASPSKSGLMYLPLALSDVLAATGTGMSLKFIGYPNPFMLFGTALLSIAAGVFTTFKTTTSHTLWIPIQVIQGLGAGMTLSMPYVATQTVLAPQDIPIGTAMLQCIQFFGASVGLAIAQAIFGNKLDNALNEADFTKADVDRILEAGSAGARTAVSTEQLPSLLGAYNISITTTFYVATAVAIASFLLTFGIPWKSIKPPKPEAVTDEEAT